MNTEKYRNNLHRFNTINNINIDHETLKIIDNLNLIIDFNENQKYLKIMIYKLEKNAIESMKCVRKLKKKLKLPID
jgi:tRNA(Glu) U13 pseudouridine synthase TruD